MSIYLEKTARLEGDLVEVDVEFFLEDVIEFIEEANPNEIRKIKNALNEYPGESVSDAIKSELLQKVSQLYTLQQLWGIFPDLK